MLLDQLLGTTVVDSATLVDSGLGIWWCQVQADVITPSWDRGLMPNTTAGKSMSWLRINFAMRENSLYPNTEILSRIKCGNYTSFSVVDYFFQKRNKPVFFPDVHMGRGEVGVNVRVRVSV